MTPEHQDNDSAPGGVSNQNAEEQPSDVDPSSQKGQNPGPGGSDDKTEGESSEGTQSTGSPSAAG